MMSSATRTQGQTPQAANEPPMPPPLDPNAPPPQGRYCDLVLKGGVIDGVVYPGALVELARHYRFHGIAGTSVGAIAASLAAACEFARRFGSDDGFNEVLRKMPDSLGTPSETRPAQSTLRALFQTEPTMQRLFDVVVAVFTHGPGTFAGRAWRAVWRGYQSRFWLGALLAAGICCVVTAVCGLTYLSWEARLLVLLATLSAGLAIFGGSIYRDFRTTATSPGFGFCSGLSTDGGATPALTDWLHKGLQGAAKLPLTRPLTFQDLWDAPMGPPPADTGQSSSRTAPRSIDLRMIATSVSHGRPYEFPLEPSTRLYFKLSELEAYFPPSIIAHLRRESRPYTEPDDTLYGANATVPPLLNSPFPACMDPNDFRELPRGALPVLVAVRLSMNLPILFKSVPLWSVDHEAGRVVNHAGQSAPRFAKNWFSDGGITSNFPIHFFDKLIPRWPTFGLYIADLDRNKTRAPTTEPTVKVTAFHTEGRSERWTEIADNPQPQGQAAFKPFLNYLEALYTSAKDWSDNVNLRMPGVRDRVAIVYKNDPANGGLNLNLDRQRILTLGYRIGVQAGQSLAQKFALDPTRVNPALNGTPGWLDHRWVRLNSAVTAVKTALTGVGAALNTAYGTSPVGTQIHEAANVPPLKHQQYFEPKLTPVQAQALAQATQALEALEVALASAPPVAPAYNAKPQAELRLRARF
jgi:predicted acylesterase/phospholipase RssA